MTSVPDSYRSMMTLRCPKTHERIVVSPAPSSTDYAAGQLEVHCESCGQRHDITLVNRD